jgi:hypothetical protein
MKGGGGLVVVPASYKKTAKIAIYIVVKITQFTKLLKIYNIQWWFSVNNCFV